MKTIAVILNLVLFGITGMIVVTEGIPRQVRYQVLTLVVLLVPLLSALVLFHRQGTRQASGGTDASAGSRLTTGVVVLANLVLLGATCWEAVVQYPYPEGRSVIPFVVLAICVPALSLVALLGGRRGALPGRA